MLLVPSLYLRNSVDLFLLEFLGYIGVYRESASEVVSDFIWRPLGQYAFAFGEASAVYGAARPLGSCK